MSDPLRKSLRLSWRLLLLVFALPPALKTHAETFLHLDCDPPLLPSVKPRLVLEGDNATFAEGIFDRAVSLGKDSRAKAAKAGPVRADSGSVEFWIKTLWDGNDGQEHELLTWGGREGVRIIKGTQGKLRLQIGMWRTGSSKGIDCEAPVHWRRDEWRYITCSWNKSGAIIQLDAFVVGRHLVKEPIALKVDQVGLILGGEAAFDEVRLHDAPQQQDAVTASFLRGRRKREEDISPHLTTCIALNGSPARMIWDTGCTPNIVFENLARTLAIKDLNVPATGVGSKFKAAIQFTPGDDPIELEWVGTTQPQRKVFQFDGILGWRDVIKHNVLFVEWEGRCMQVKAPASTTPPGATVVKLDPAQWIMLARDVPLVIGNLSERVDVTIDTGDPDGLALDAGLWNRLEPQLRGQPCELTAAWNPLVGVVVEKSYLLQQVQLFGLPMHRVVISRDNLEGATINPPKQERDAKPQVRMGLGALSNFATAINGLRSELWLRPLPEPVLKPKLDFSGLLERPSLTEENVHSTVVVEDGSKAWKLGLRTDDVVLEINGVSTLKTPDQIAEKEAGPLPLWRRIDLPEPLTLKVRRADKEIKLVRAEDEKPETAQLRGFFTDRLFATQGGSLFKFNPDGTGKKVWSKGEASNPFTWEITDKNSVKIQADKAHWFWFESAERGQIADAADGARRPITAKSAAKE